MIHIEGSIRQTLDLNNHSFVGMIMMAGIFAVTVVEDICDTLAEKDKRLMRASSTCQKNCRLTV